MVLPRRAPPVVGVLEVLPYQGNVLETGSVEIAGHIGITKPPPLSYV